MPTRERPGQRFMTANFGRNAFGEKVYQSWWVSARIPSLVAKAARQEGFSSNSHYIRTAILKALERDLGIDFEEMSAEQPTKASNPFYADPAAYGVANSAEEVRE